MGWRGRYALLFLLLGGLASPAPAQSTDTLAATPVLALSDFYGDGVLGAGSFVLRPRASAATGYRRMALTPPPADRWLGVDKAQHAAFSFLWTVSSQYTLVNKLDVSERRALPFSVGSGMLLGLSKELYDGSTAPRNRFSYRDLAADAFGIALALGLIVL